MSWVHATRSIISWNASPTVERWASFSRSWTFFVRFGWLVDWQKHFCDWTFSWASIGIFLTVGAHNIFSESCLMFVTHSKWHFSPVAVSSVCPIERAKSISCGNFGIFVSDCILMIRSKRSQKISRKSVTPQNPVKAHGKCMGTLLKTCRKSSEPPWIIDRKSTE